MSKTDETDDDNKQITLAIKILRSNIRKQPFTVFIENNYWESFEKSNKHKHTHTHRHTHSRSASAKTFPRDLSESFKDSIPTSFLAGNSSSTHFIIK